MADITRGVGNRPYSLLIDESTDVNVTKYLGVALINYDEVKEEILHF